MLRKKYSCTPDKEIRGFSLGYKFCSFPGVLTEANYINALQFFGGVVQEKESNMGFCCRWAFPTRRMTVLSGTEATA